ncbi:aldolase/citrate lyase family protein [Yoonia sp. GPGPB17]|uniref:HpcH/HpaI aldolase family protein n=1 Tax=Yoonia sp. GPGPB17 TaxID=3026147 RepID=UPI0030BCF397
MWVSLSNNYAAEVVASAGYDWLLVDMEHAPSDMSTVLGQLQAIAPHGSTAIVRPPWNDTVMVKRLLDIGAPGLLFPMVQSVEEAQAAVAACRYPPKGVRGVAGSIRANSFGRVVDYYANADKQTAVILQVETQAAVAQALEIGQVDGVDGVFFGPADIAADMGLLGAHMSDEVWDLILHAAGKLMDAGIPVGTLVTDPAFASRLLAEGFTFVACGTDTNLLAKGADALLAQMRKATGKENV